MTCLHLSLSGPAREYIGEILHEVVTEWNSSEKCCSGVKTAFERTINANPDFEEQLFSGDEADADEDSSSGNQARISYGKGTGKPVRQLQKRLDACEENGWPGIYNPYGHDPDNKHVCPVCSHRFASSEKLEEHSTPCWALRPQMDPPKHRPEDLKILTDLGIPLREDPNHAPIGLIFETESGRFGFVVKIQADQHETNFM